MLKAGLTQLELKQTAAGKATLQKLVQTYPQSNAARLAQQQLAAQQ
jgi:TolA-binding protein